jgi:hypothetical protein
MKRMSDVSWECGDFYPTSVQEQTENGAWVRTSMPRDGDGDYRVSYTKPDAPGWISGNRGEADSRALPNQGRSVNHAQNNTGAPGNHNNEYPDMGGPKAPSTGGY